MRKPYGLAKLASQRTVEENIAIAKYYQEQTKNYWKVKDRKKVRQVAKKEIRYQRVLI